MKTLRMLLSFALLFVPFSAQAKEDGTRLKVVVTIAPLARFVSGVTQDTADIVVMVPPGSDPHSYEPKPEQLKELSSADVYVMLGSGMDFERAWMDKLRALNRKMLICDAGKGIELIDAEEHEHGLSALAHRHGNKDPHIWLSPANAVIMVRNIEKSLAAANPDNTDFYAVNAREYIVELKRLDAELKEKLAAQRGRAFLVFHPAWGYFAKEFGLREMAVEVAGKEPTVRELALILEEAKENKCRTVFVSPQFSKRTSEVIAKEIGGTVVSVDSLAGDYEENLRRVAEEFSKSME